MGKVQTEEKKKKGRRLAQARHSAGLSGEAFAEKMDVTPQTISQYENGRINLSMERAQQAAEILNCTAEYLLCLSDHPTQAAEKNYNKRQELLEKSGIAKRKKELKSVCNLLSRYGVEICNNGLPQEDDLIHIVIDGEEMLCPESFYDFVLQDIFDYLNLKADQIRHKLKYISNLDRKEIELVFGVESYQIGLLRRALLKEKKGASEPDQSDPVPQDRDQVQ